MKTFVEPMLLWKGDASQVPNATQIPEGSVTRPSPGVTCGTGEDGDGANDGVNGNDGAHALESIPIFLRDNYCAILMDDECGAESA